MDPKKRMKNKIMKLNIYSSKGVKKGTLNLPKSLVEKENLSLLAQAVRVYENRMHEGTSKVKTRAEVSASGAKIWRQKGTGRARHGDIKAPIFVGGGKAHGPKGVKRNLKISHKMRKKALAIALGLKATDAEVVVADSLSRVGKTKGAQKLLNELVKKQLKGKNPNRVTIALSEKNKAAEKFFRNIENTQATLFKNLNAHKVFFGGLIVIDKDALPTKK